jgi:hypothetical protein
MDREIAINHSLIYLANGLLAIFYFLYAHGPLLLALLCSALVFLVYDRGTRKTVGDRPRRYGRGPQVQASYRPYWETALTVLLWSVASFLSAPPIPIIGGLMWLAFVVALRYIPQERENLLFRQKVMIAVYALIALTMRGLFTYSPDLSRLAAVMGGRGEAADLFSTVRDGMMPYAALVIWVMYPLGYFAMIVQRFAINRSSLLKPSGTLEDYIRDLRTRGERSR